MSVESSQEPEPRISPSIRFINQYLSKRSPGQMIGLMLGRVDAFNRISTTFGIERTRIFCAEYAETLRNTLPPGTPIVRLSDRRFAILVSAEKMSQISSLATAITEDHQPQMQMGDDNFLVDVTFGIAMCPTHADDADSLFRRAELALQRAQEEDLTYDIYQTDSTQQRATLWKLESNLKRAIAERQLEVYYQPKINLRERSVMGVEALVRWSTDEGYSMSPETFIPLAEQSGTIVPLTWLVFDIVLEAVRAWGRFEKPFGVAVNIAPQSAHHPEFYNRLKAFKAALAELNVRLAIELTEDSLLQCDSQSVLQLHKVRDLDVDLSIDDFGKGYSSLTYLKQLPATEIKIDKKFIETIGVDSTDQQIVKAVIDLAHALGMQVVAEGVDSEENYSMVLGLGCDLAQGFLIARPMTADRLLDWVSSFSPQLSLQEDSNSLRGLLGFAT